MFIVRREMYKRQEVSEHFLPFAFIYYNFIL